MPSKNNDTADGERRPPSYAELAGLIMANMHIKKADGHLYWYDAARGVYDPWGEEAVRQALAKLLGDVWTPSKADGVVKYLEATAPGMWVHPHLHKINVRNGILDLDTMKLGPHSPDFLSPIQIGAAYTPEATCPAVDKFISEVFPEDSALLAYEIAGYLLTPDTSLDAAFLLVGDGSNGKSRYCDLLQGLLGQANVSSVPLQTLDQSRFAAADLYGKLANINADLDAEGLRSCGTFKAIVSGDTIRAEHKYGQPFSFRPYARLIFSTNTMPMSVDFSHGFFRRWKIIPFQRRFEGAERDLKLREKLTSDAERSGLLNRALEALSGLRARQAFTHANSLAVAHAEFELTLDPVRAFVQERLVPDPEGRIGQPALACDFNDWCKANGRPTMTARTFNKLLRERIVIEHCKSGGVDYWVGISIRPQYEVPAA